MSIFIQGTQNKTDVIFIRYSSVEYRSYLTINWVNITQCNWVKFIFYTKIEVNMVFLCVEGDLVILYSMRKRNSTEFLLNFFYSLRKTLFEMSLAYKCDETNKLTSFWPLIIRKSICSSLSISTFYYLIYHPLRDYNTLKNFFDFRILMEDSHHLMILTTRPIIIKFSVTMN